MSQSLENLNYLRNDTLAGFSADIFGSALRLPILGAILELTPDIEVDRFYGRQISSALNLDPANTHREIKRAVRNGMVIRDKLQSESNSQLLFERLATQRWDIVELSLIVAKREFEL